MRQWFVVYTHPREEALAEEHLRRQGFEAYWPRYRKRVSHARSVREAPASLFPRYLFTAFDAGQGSWRAIRSTRAVVDIVRQGFEPVPVCDRLVTDIRSREDANGYVVLGRQIELQKGQRIHIDNDAFKGHELIFEAKKDSDRVVALLRLLGREFEVAVPLGSIRPMA